MQERQTNISLPTGTSLPIGTVTFLFTDIVGSTPLWESQPDLMAQALEIHNTALREAIESHGGIVFKTVGDAFQAAFPTAPQALRAAIAGQRALQEAPWNELGELKVRMGLHTGEAELDPGGDEYAVSHTKNRIGRIHATAHGGQILISAETKELVDHHLPEGVTLKDLGEHRLKGMGWLEHLYQVCTSGLLEEFPSLVTTINHPNNLPLELTSFIGREKEIEAVCGLLSTNRMVTLTGVGGTGKTRLSLHVASLVLEDYPNGAWLVELAGLSDPAMVPRTAASVLNLPEIAGKPVTESLVDYLRGKRLLLVLDNCEHLLEACIDLAERLLRACPDLTILASSREFLGVTGEVPYRLPPMSLPDTRQGTDASQLSAYDAVKLFVERARVVAPDFVVTAENASAVVQVVERLDGIPLAIELAAARLRLLSVAQIAQRLDDAFRLLTGGSRSRLPRHQTLRASIDWSYNLLSEPERILLRRLSVFSGSWRLSAAERVCADLPGPEAVIQPDEVLDLVTGLLDKSLIQTISGADGLNRFRMLETVRQYAHEKLAAEGESEAVRDRHLAYYLAWVEVTAPKTRGREQVQTLDQLELELDNLRLALDWGLQTDLEAELNIASQLMWFWHIRSYNMEGASWLDRGLDLGEENLVEETRQEPTRFAGIDPMVRAGAMVVLGFFRWIQFFKESPGAHYDPAQAANILEGAISIYQELDPERNQEAKRGLAWAQIWLGYNLLASEDDRKRAQVLTQGALSAFKSCGDRLGEAECLQSLGNCSSSPDQMMRLHQDQLAIHEKLGDPHGMSNAHLFIGMALYWKGEYEAARDSFKAGLKNALLVTDPLKIPQLSLFIGATSISLGALEEADVYLQRSLDGYREIGVTSLIVDSLFFKSRLRIAQGHYEQAGELIDEAWVITQRAGLDGSIVDVLTLRARLARLQGDTGLALETLDTLPPLDHPHPNQKIAVPLEKGLLALQIGDLVEAGRWFQEAIKFLDSPFYLTHLQPFFDGAATYAARLGVTEAAARLFGSRWCRAYVHFLSPVEKEWRDGDWAAMRDALGEARFEALHEEGESLTYDQAVTLTREVLEA